MTVHSKAIAAKAGRLIAIDQDPDAIKVLHERLDDLGNVTIVQNNFSNVDQVLKELNVASIDGMLLDLGVSSFQLDTADRGFSYHKDAPLDMRMSKSGLSAKDVVNTYSEEELANIIKFYDYVEVQPVSLRLRIQRQKCVIHTRQEKHFRLFALK